MDGLFSWRDDPAMPVFPDDAPLVVFDGDCVLCSRSMRLLARLDRARVFRMTPAQGAIGQALYRHLGLPTDRFETYLLVADGRIHQRSDAIVEIARRLRRPWKAAVALAIIPRRLRDALYGRVARHRYRIFGRREACGLRDPALTDRLI